MSPRVILAADGGQRYHGRSGTEGAHHMRRMFQTLAAAIGGLVLAASPAAATPINFYLGVDDHGSLTINGTNLITLNCPGSCSNTVLTNLPGGWYSIEITYANYGGSTNLFFSQDYTLGGPLDLVPKSWLRSLDASGAYVQGLRADYYSGTNLTGFLGTVYGEGPIGHGYNAGYPYWYQGQTNTSGFGWGPYIANAGWSVFSERLTGEIYIPATVPEPGSWILLGSGLLGIVALRRRRSVRQRIPD